MSNPIIAIDAYLRLPGGTLKPGRVALEYADHYRTGRKTWWLAGTIIELGKPSHTELRGWSDLDDGPAIKMPPLVIPALGLLAMSRVEHPDELAAELAAPKAPRGKA
jgi:hypothetical protein